MLAVRKTLEVRTSPPPIKTRRKRERWRQRREKKYPRKQESRK
jgi:hypothetical protein